MQKRIFYLKIFFLVCFFILTVRLFCLQVINGKLYRIKSEKNRIRLKEIPAYRGRILDRNGMVLVDNRPFYSLCVIPEEVPDVSELFNKLSRIIDIPSERLKKIFFKKKTLPFKPVCIKKGLTLDEVAKIESNIFLLPGVMIKVEERRNYIYHEMLAHVLGYMSSDGKGRCGIEKRWDKFLKGIPGGMQIEADAVGRTVKVISKRLPVPGADVYLNIDIRIQKKAQQLLKGKKGAIVVMNPKDGEVIAIASSPSFDPNLFIDGIDIKTWNRLRNSKDCPFQNRAISGLYPPGSLFKVIVAYAGLKEGIITPKKTFFCKGSFFYGDREYRCWKKGGHGNVNLHRAIKESCDIYFYNLGKMLGIKKIAYYAKMFGLGEETGIDIGGEKKGIVPTAEWKKKRFGIPWQSGETLSVSIGQSYLLVTPIQIAVMYSALFNGGILYKPRITRLIKTADGKVLYRFRPEIKRRLNLDERHVREIRKALVAVVNEANGTGRRARIRGITVAGKTGTAQLIEHRRDEEISIKDHAWFVGIAPAEDPTVVVVVIIENGGHGGESAAPVAREIIKEYFRVFRKKDLPEL